MNNNTSREALIADLKSACIDGTLSATLVTKAADMLEADAQQVAVPVPMSDEQIKDVVWGYVEDSSNIPEHIVGIIRAIEAHHGIGAKP